jgi:hypothetical protein
VFLPINTGITGQPAAETLYWRTSVRRKNAEQSPMAGSIKKNRYKTSKMALLLHLIITALQPNF